MLVGLVRVATLAARMLLHVVGRQPVLALVHERLEIVPGLPGPTPDLPLGDVPAAMFRGGR